MPGIDLIDLSDPLLRKREANALRLIVHTNDTCPEDLGFWYLWTAKEAVFKLQRELTNFNPKEIPIHVSANQEEVTFTSGNYEGFFVKKEDVLVAVAMNAEEEVDFQILKCEDRHQSESIRKATIEYLEETYQIKSAILSDGDGLPIFSINEEPVSFTHHYHYMGFAFDSRTFKSSLPH